MDIDDEAHSDTDTEYEEGEIYELGDGTKYKTAVDDDTGKSRLVHFNFEIKSKTYPFSLHFYSLLLPSAKIRFTATGYQCADQLCVPLLRVT